MTESSNNPDLESLGSDTAKAGFANERSVEKILNRESSVLRNSILSRLGIPGILSMTAKIVHRQKSDIVLSLNLDTGQIRNLGIQVKLVSNTSGFNQVDKRYVEKYQKMWGFSDLIAQALKKYTGEIEPSTAGRSQKRMFADELSIDERQSILDFFASNKAIIANSIFLGEEEIKPEWFLLVHKLEDMPKVYLYRIEDYIRFYIGGLDEPNVIITNKGSFRLGRITIQRKGGDGGRRSATMLQFKLDPVEITK